MASPAELALAQLSGKKRPAAPGAGSVPPGPAVDGPDSEDLTEDPNAPADAEDLAPEDPNEPPDAGELDPADPSMPGEAPDPSTDPQAIIEAVTQALAQLFGMGQQAHAMQQANAAQQAMPGIQDAIQQALHAAMGPSGPPLVPSAEVDRQGTGTGSLPPLPRV